jgi:nucleotide-binding universal stress UspA family protein
MQAQRYLGRIASRLETKGDRVRTEILSWPPAESIASYAEHNGVDIIVMSSHGRSGPGRWAHGSVADRILRASRVPVLIIRAPGCIPGI